jgi:hypothetical protein
MTFIKKFQFQGVFIWLQNRTLKLVIFWLRVMNLHRDVIRQLPVGIFVETVLWIYWTHTFIGTWPRVRNHWAGAGW